MIKKAVELTKDAYRFGEIDKLLYGVIITSLVLLYEYGTMESISTQAAHVITIVSLGCIGGKVGKAYVDHLKNKK